MTYQPTLPQIFVASHDDGRLRQVATPLASRGSWIAKFLLSELDRSITCGPGDLPDDTVAMGCRVTYRVDDSNDAENALLVYPEDYFPYRGRLSVLTAVGAALFGLRAGSSISCRPPGGADQMITVLRVDGPPPANVLPFRPRSPQLRISGLDPEPD